MNASILSTALLLAYAFATAASAEPDAECERRRQAGLPNHWPNPTDAGSFYRCTDQGVKVKIDCSAAREYSAKMGRCVPRRKGSNNLSPIAPLAGDNNACYNQSSGVLLPRKGFCRDFYVCRENKAYLQKCKPGSIFDTTGGNCVPDGAKKCWQNSCIGVANGVNLPDKNSCRGFYICQTGEVVKQTCSSGSYFNVVSENCIPDASNNKCWENYCLKRSNGEIVASDDDDCPRCYYVCFDKKPVPQECPVGSHFNKSALNCEPDERPNDTTTEKTTEGSTEESTKITTNPTTEVITKPTTPATPKPTTEATTKPTTPATPKPTTEVTTKPTTPRTPKPTTEVTTKPTTPATPKPTTEVTTKPTTPATPKPTTEVTTKPTTPATPKPTTAVTTKPTTPATPKPTTEVTTKPTTPRTPKPTTEVTTKPTTPRTPKPTTEVTTKSTTPATPKPTTEVTTKPTTPATPKPTTEVTTKPTTPRTPKPTTEVTTKPTTPRTPKPTTEVTTKSTTPATPKPTTEVTTKPTTPATPKPTTEVTTKPTTPRTPKPTTEVTTKPTTPATPKPTTEVTTKPTTPATPKPTTAVTTKPTSPTDDDCSCAGGYSKGDLVPHPTSCNLFFICDNSELVEQSCQPGNYFNPELGACARDVDGVCAHRKVPLFRQKRSDNGDLEEGDKSLNATKSDSEKISNVLLPAKVNESTLLTCLGRYSEGQLIADPDDCQLFSICFKGHLIRQSCGIGRYFDKGVGVCQMDVAGFCSRKLNSNSIVLSAVEEDQICTCPGGYWNGEIVPHPTDCNKFFICFDRELHESECGDGNRFDGASSACVRDTDAICTPLARDCTCPGGYQPGQLVPHPGNLRLYFVCHDSKLVESDCGVGNRFDDAAGACVPDSCDSCSAPPVSDECRNHENNAMVADPKHCGSFYLCLNGVAQPKSCAASDWFDPEWGSCILDVDAECRNPCESTKGTVMLPHPDLGKFYVCNDGLATIGKCGPGRSFSAKHQACMLGGFASSMCAGKPDGTTFPVPNDDSSFYYCKNGIELLQSCGKDATYDARKSVCLPRPSPDCNQELCRTNGAQNGKAAPTLNGNATSFCICRNGAAYKESCPTDRLFDKQRNICSPSSQDAPCDSSRCLNDDATNTPFVNPTDTHSFCMCKSKKAIVIPCPENGFFDPKLLLCIPPPKEVPGCDRNRCANAAVGHAYATSDNDPRDFCYCSGLSAVTRLSCTDGKLFDAQRGICLDQTVCEGKYAQYQTVANPEACDKYRLCLDGRMLELSCCNGLYYEAAALQCLPNDNGQCKDAAAMTCTCPGGYAEGQFVPHPSDCRRFYICANAALHEEDCGEGNRYDETERVCKRDTAGVCNGGHTQLTLHSANIRKRAAPLTMHESSCIEDQRRPVPANCSQYEVCQRGVWRRVTCTPSLYFNAEEQRCQQPRDDTVCSHARVAGVPACDAELENYVVPGRTQHCGSYLRCSRGKWRLKYCSRQQLFSPFLRTCIDSNDSNICRETKPPVTSSAVGCIERQVRHSERNCNKYFMCLGAEWWLHNCPLGMYFNRSLNYCVPNNAGQCATAELQLSEQLVYSNCRREGALRASDLDCGEFYVCAAGSWFSQKCGRQQYFNATQGTCVPVDDTCRPLALPQCAAGRLQAVPLNCSAYMRCSDEGDEWLRLECSSGHYFDEELATCMPNDGSCASNGLRRTCRVGDTKPHPKSESCSDFLLCSSSGEWRVNSCLRGYKYAPQAKKCLRGECGRDDGAEDNEADEDDSNVATLTSAQPSDTFCSDKKNGSLVPHAHNCTRYHICIDERAHPQTCSSGRYFNATQLLCLPDDGSCPLLVPADTERQPNASTCVGRNGDLLVDPNNCNEFYVCINGKLRHERCYAGHYFDAATLQCRARNSSIQEANVTARYNKSIDNETQLVADEMACRDPPTNFTQLCSQLNSIASMAEKDDCRRFIACEEGKVVAQRCRNGESYDSLLALCRQNDGTCLLENGQRVGVCSGKHGQLARDTTNCRGFFVCIHGQKIEAACEEGQYFNKTENMCRVDELSQCGAAKSNEESNDAVAAALVVTPVNAEPAAKQNHQPSHAGDLNSRGEEKLCKSLPRQRYANHEDGCRSFFVCRSNHTLQQVVCPAGTLYDARAAACKEAAFVVCSEG